jgi:PAS domain S-box-containing protein
MEGLLGLSEGELLSMNLAQVSPKEELRRSRSSLEKVFQKGRCDKANGRKITKNDRRVPLNFVASKVEYRDKPDIQGIFRDLAECGKPDQIQVQQYRDHLSFLQNFFKIPSS